MEGLSNPEIATKLLLSRRTVATHVSHILRKLGVNSRIDIAREAACGPARRSDLSHARQRLPGGGSSTAGRLAQSSMTRPGVATPTSPR